MSDPSKVFGDIYRTKKWGEGSGGGSDPAVCGPYCRLVERLIEDHGVSAVLDIGCGDGRVDNAINWQGAWYIGMDCASARTVQINHPSMLYTSDALSAPLPRAGLVLIKEVLQHLPNADVIRLMERLKDYPLVLHCSGYDGVVNADIEMGQTRPVDLSLPPFNLQAKTILTYGGGYNVQLVERR